jgi:hypothetical protein
MEGYLPPLHTRKLRLRVQEQFYFYFTLKQAFTNQGSAENHYGFPDKSWNKHIKISKCSEKHQISLEIQQNFFTFNLTYKLSYRYRSTFTKNKKKS